MTVQLSVNIAMEGTMVLLLSIVLLTCLWQKKMFVTTTPLISLLSISILVHLVRIVIWSMFLQDFLLKYGLMPFRFIYILEYVIHYASTVIFYYYMDAIIKARYKEAGLNYQASKHIYTTMIVWGVVTAIGYAILLFIPSLYHVEMGREVYSIPAYVVLAIMIKFALFCVLVLVIRHRKIMHWQDAVLTVLFIILFSVLNVIDEMYGLCISYVLMSILVFLLFVRIDLYKGLMLERQEKEIVEWKTQIMLSQMQPHFLYNVLTTISSMCEMQNATQARDVVNRFADYLRVNLDSLGKERTISFEKELEHVETYLWLEKIRFEDMLEVRYEIEAKDFELPSLTIQPIVENAVKHGILPKEDAGTVTIKTYETAQDYVIIVEDDGVGFDVNALREDGKAHVGIENVTKRLELICSGSCMIQSEVGRGTVVTIHIPKGDEK